MLDRLIYWLLRLFCIEYSHEEVKKKRQLAEEVHEIDLSSEKHSTESLRLLLETAKEGQNRQKERTASVTDKMKTLLILVTVLIPFTIQFISEHWFGWILTVAAIVMEMVAITLLLFFLAPKTFSEVDISGTPKEKEEEVLKDLIRDYRKAACWNQSVNDFLVDIFRATTRAFTLSLLIVVVQAVFHFASLESSEQKQQNWARNVLMEIRKDELYQKLITHFRTTLDKSLPQAQNQLAAEKKVDSPNNLDRPVAEKAGAALPRENAQIDPPIRPQVEPTISSKDVGKLPQSPQ